MEVRYKFESSQEELDINEDQQMDEENDSPRPYKVIVEDGLNIHEDENVTPKQESHDDDHDAYDAQLQEMSDNNNLVPPNDDDQVPSNNDINIQDEDQDDIYYKREHDAWELPPDRNDCTLEEIRRGQVVNKKAPNECPVMDCDKKINEMRAEPSPGTIASGLRTHVLFVHYPNKRINKKRKLCWSNKRRSQASPRKQVGQSLSPSTSIGEYDLDSQSSAASNNQTTGLNLMHKPNHVSPQGNTPGSILNKKVKQIAARSQSHQMSSLQSLMQATAGGVGARLSPQPKQNHNSTTNGVHKNNFNSTTSSLFSILAGLTQQQQINQQPQQQHQPLPPQQQQHPSSLLRSDLKPNPATTNASNLSNILKNPNSTNNRPANSSLLSLLNEKISGSVASSLQSQLKKSLAPDQRIKHPTTTPRQNVPAPTNSSYYHSNNNDAGFNNNSSILNNLCSGNGDNRSSYDNSMPLNSFIESIAIKTGSNIGQAGVVEAKKIIEKFTTSLICSSQTIADHYLAPFVGEVPQQKPEVSPSDIVLAYKMMHKSHGQP